MRLTLSDLCQTFSDRADWTNRIIGGGLSTRLGLLEETITDVNLIMIQDRHPDHVLTRKFSRKEEGSSSGADWLWCIGEPGSWLLLLVQAKIVNPKTGTCHYLNYKNGKQRRLLKQYAKRHNLMPLYCIYNHIPSGYAPPPKARQAFSGLAPEQWACSFLTPYRIHRLVQQKRTKHADILNHALPWIYPCCHSDRKQTDRLAVPLADAFFNADRELSEMELSPERRDEYFEDVVPSDYDPQEIVNEELPRVVLDLLRGRRSPSKAPVAGLSVISSLSVRPVLSEYRALPPALSEQIDFPEQTPEADFQRDRRRNR